MSDEEFLVRLILWTIAGFSFVGIVGLVAMFVSAVWGPVGE